MTKVLFTTMKENYNSSLRHQRYLNSALKTLIFGDKRPK